MADNSDFTQEAPQLQEAIDLIAQTFNYPDEVSIHHSLVDGNKRTTFEIIVDGDESQYELFYDGETDEAEPELTQSE